MLVEAKDSPGYRGDVIFDRNQKLREAEIGRKIERDGRNYEVRECGHALWQWIPKPRKWAPAQIIHKKLRGFFDYLLIDEAHESKASANWRSVAAGKMIASSGRTLAMTGTLIGGYANHVFPLAFRLVPRSFMEEGLAWTDVMEFTRRYGKVDVITTTKDGGAIVGQNTSNSKSLAVASKTTRREAPRPGIMPTLFGRHVMHNSLHMTLEEMGEVLPDFKEFVADGSVGMSPEIEAEYNRISGIISARNGELLIRGCHALLGTYLQTTLTYADYPHDWPWVGYKCPDSGSFIKVVQPKHLDPTVVSPKEQHLIDICLQEKSEGRQTWIYVQTVTKFPLPARLKDLLEAQGLRVGVLYKETVDRRKREKWIEDNGKRFDVVISNPELVKTGLDLFSPKPGGHNFATLIFYQTGYNLFTMRQASRRAWRIGQPKECRVYYLYYKETMQDRAVTLMARKMQASAWGDVQRRPRIRLAPRNPQSTRRHPEHRLRCRVAQRRRTRRAVCASPSARIVIDPIAPHNPDLSSKQSSRSQ